MNIKSSSITLNDQVETLENARRRLMIGLMVTMLLWFVPRILEDVAPVAMPPALKTILILAGTAGAFLWMAFMFRYHRFQATVRANPELLERLDDERATWIRREAIYRGWLTLIIAIGLGVGIAPFVEIPDQVILLTLLLVGVNAPLVFFLRLDRG